MNSSFSHAAPRFGAALALAGLATLAAAPAGAQTAGGVIQTFSTLGNNFAVAQTDYNVTGKYNSKLVTTASGTDDFERLLGYDSNGNVTGPATLTIDPKSPEAASTVDSGNPLPGLADASQGKGGGPGFTIFGGDGGDGGTDAQVAAAKAMQATVVDFTFNDPNAPAGDTLTGLGLTTLGTGDGREYYDVTFAYSTDGVTFTPFLTAQDSGAAFPTTGATDEFLQASGISIPNVKVLQLTERPNISAPGNQYYLQGSAISEVDVFFSPTAPVPEASSLVSLGSLLTLGLGGLAFARRRKAASDKAA